MVELDADTGEGVEVQTRAVEADGVGAPVDTARRTVGVAAAWGDGEEAGRTASRRACAALRSATIPIDFGLLGTELALGLGQRGHRRLLSSRGLAGCLVGALLGGARRRCPIRLLGAGAMQISQHVAVAEREGLVGAGRGDDVLGAGRRNKRLRWAIDVGGSSEVVDALRRGGDRPVGIGQPSLASLHVAARGRGSITGVANIHEGLVDTFLLTLNLRADFCQTLIGLGEVGDEDRDLRTRMGCSIWHSSRLRQ